MQKKSRFVVDANTSGKKIQRRAIARQSVTHTQRSNDYVSQVKKGETWRSLSKSGGNGSNLSHGD